MKVIAWSCKAWYALSEIPEVGIKEGSWANNLKRCSAPYWLLGIIPFSKICRVNSQLNLILLPKYRTSQIPDNLRKACQYLDIVLTWNFLTAWVLVLVSLVNLYCVTCEMLLTRLETNLKEITSSSFPHKASKPPNSHHIDLKGNPWRFLELPNFFKTPKAKVMK